MASLKLVRGIYVPVPAFFKNDATQSLDIEAHETHILWLAKAGVQGVLIQGSTAEAVTLTNEERNEITKATRGVLDKNGFNHVLVIAGAGAQSVLEAVALAKDAHAAGADHILVLPPSYFASNLTPDAIINYFTKVADESPLPLLIYSFPAASGGLEISSDTFAVLAKHPKIVAVKQTDNLVGKMARNVWLNKNEEFLVLGGGSDYLIGALAVGAHGAITGIANGTPKLVLKLMRLWDEGKFAEAVELQGHLSFVEGSMLSGGIPGIKAATQVLTGRGGIPRYPTPAVSDAFIEKFTRESASLLALEAELWKET
ncbi:aldolase [Clavulina sp. PMI_390]|nr:aldolase [Clavulina sp. PMI_390]